jgi:glycine cleavage system H protein
VVIPDDLKYTTEHEWVRLGESSARVGITDYAQDALGDVVFVSLPEPGRRLSAGESCGEVESTKSVSEIYAPVSGTVVARNETLETRPDLVNQDPYGDGWLLDLEPAAGTDPEDLLTAADYAKLTDGSAS